MIKKDDYLIFDIFEEGRLISTGEKIIINKLRICISTGEIELIDSSKRILNLFDLKIKINGIYKNLLKLCSNNI